MSCMTWRYWGSTWYHPQQCHRRMFSIAWRLTGGLAAGSRLSYSQTCRGRMVGGGRRREFVATLISNPHGTDNKTFTGALCAVNPPVWQSLLLAHPCCRSSAKAKRNSYFHCPVCTYSFPLVLESSSNMQGHDSSLVHECSNA